MRQCQDSTSLKVIKTCTHNSLLLIRVLKVFSYEMAQINLNLERLLMRFNFSQVNVVAACPNLHLDLRRKLLYFY